MTGGALALVTDGLLVARCGVEMFAPALPQRPSFGVELD